MAKGLFSVDAIEHSRRQLNLQRNLLGTGGGYGFSVTADAEAALSIRGGGLSIASSNVDNNEAFLVSDGEIAQPGDDKPLYFEAEVQFTEANTDDAGVYVGISSTAPASVLTDDGAGIPADFTGFAFYKLDGETLWRVAASVGTGQELVQLTAANSLDGVAKTAGTAAYQRLEIIVTPKTAAKADVMFLIDGITVYKLTDFTITSALVGALMAIVKAGGANAETLKIKYLNFQCMR